MKVGFDTVDKIYIHILCLQSVGLLMEQCPLLISCMELDYWTAINPPELTSFQQNLRLNNIRLKILEDRDEIGESVGGIPSGAHLPENMCGEDFHSST